MSDGLFWDSVPENTRGALEAVKALPMLSDFYLAGGTALALQIGHRVSHDLDFFSSNNQLAYGLRYFDDAENDPRELVLKRPVRWQDVKKYCEAGARLLTQINIGLQPKGL